MKDSITQTNPDRMDRVNAILRHPLYRQYYEKLEEMEQDRIYCRHQMQHLMDVARIAYIYSLEQDLGIEKDLIYAAAVLHDIGKCEQYGKNIPHEKAGEAAAEQILDTLDENMKFTGQDKARILTAIRGHRRLRENPEPLERILYEADKASRMCFACPAEQSCNWSTEKKNMEIKI